MLKDWKDFWIYWQLYKKGKIKMEKIKEFIKEHKNQILIGTSAIVIYGIGYKHGYHSSMNAVDRFVNNIIKEASKVVEVSKF